jgi:hypothetical protein
MPLFLFIFSIFFNIQQIHSFNHIHTIHLSVAIRWGLSPYLPTKFYGKPYPDLDPKLEPHIANLEHSF